MKLDLELLDLPLQYSWYDVSHEITIYFEVLIPDYNSYVNTKYVKYPKWKRVEFQDYSPVVEISNAPIGYDEIKRGQIEDARKELSVYLDFDYFKATIEHLLYVNDCELYRETMMDLYGYYWRDCNKVCNEIRPIPIDYLL